MRSLLFVGSLTLATAAPQPPNWLHAGPAPVGHSVQLTFAVRNQHIAELERTLAEISDPRHASYGQWLSQTELSALTAPADEHVSTVLSFLAGHTLDSASPNHDLIQVTLGVATAAELLGAQYHVFRDRQSNATTLRMLTPPQLPAAVAAALDFVSPTTWADSLPPHGHKKRRVASAVASAKIASRWGSDQTPTSLRKRYSVGDVEGSSTKNKQAVTGFLDQFYSNTDLQSFFKQYYPKAIGRNLTTVGDGGLGNPGVEASLDTEYIMSMGGGVPSEFWSFKGNAPGTEAEPWFKFLTALASATEPPLVISMSYSEPEADIPAPYASRCNDEFKKAAARGISLIVSSGDQGVAGESGCGSKCPAHYMCLMPRFPPGSPWITVVGGTDIGPTDSEIGWSMSSGGFSNRYAMPSYQAAAVGAYVKLGENGGLPPANRYNQTGRAFPDVSALATNFETVGGGLADGTSCSAPTFGGIVSLLNDVRLKAGKPQLGFLNPWLYQHAAMLTDVTAGSSQGCYTNGFPAKPGWDGVTGLGTPDYAKMVAAMDIKRA